MHETCIILLVSCVSFSRKYIQKLTDLRASSISNIKSGIPGIQKVFGGNLICRAGLDLPTLALDMRHALSGFEMRWPGICMAMEQLYWITTFWCCFSLKLKLQLRKSSWTKQISAKHQQINHCLHTAWLWSSWLRAKGNHKWGTWIPCHETAVGVLAVKIAASCQNSTNSSKSSTAFAAWHRFIIIHDHSLWFKLLHDSLNGLNKPLKIFT